MKLRPADLGWMVATLFLAVLAAMVLPWVGWLLGF